MAGPAWQGRKGFAAHGLTVRVIWSPQALRQLDKVFDYLNELNPRAAIGVSAKLIEAGDSLANFPHRGRRVAQSEVRELVPAYPYTIRYRIVRDLVRIIRVRHTARRPTKP